MISVAKAGGICRKLETKWRCVIGVVNGDVVLRVFCYFMLFSPRHLEKMNNILNLFILANGWGRNTIYVVLVENVWYCTSKDLNRMISE